MAHAEEHPRGMTLSFLLAIHFYSKITIQFLPFQNNHFKIVMPLFMPLTGDQTIVLSLQSHFGWQRLHCNGSSLNTKHSSTAHCSNSEFKFLSRYAGIGI